MRKKIIVGVLTATLALSMNMTAFAGQWLSNDTGWWWQEDDGSYPADTWKWLDGNEDGIAECYYFDSNGYMLANTITPDNCSVNENGAWVVDGVIQTQQVAGTEEQTQENAQAANDVPDISGTYKGLYQGQPIEAVIEKSGDTFWVEIDYFLKDEMPDYQGNHVFESEWYSYQFDENGAFIFTDKTTGELVAFAKMS